MAVKENWKMRLEQARKLRSQGAALIYQRVKILVTLYEDDEFREWCLAEGKVDLDELDDELSDVGFDFLTLKKVLETFPEELDWKRQRLQLLVAEVLGKKKSERTREAISWKERALAAEKECERLRAEVSQLTARVAQFESHIADMRTALAAR